MFPGRLWDTTAGPAEHDAAHGTHRRSARRNLPSSPPSCPSLPTMNHRRPNLVDAILDRIVHDAHQIELQRGSLRRDLHIEFMTWHQKMVIE